VNAPLQRRSNVVITAASEPTPGLPRRETDTTSRPRSPNIDNKNTIHGRSSSDPTSPSRPKLVALLRQEREKES
jgi:hypothetical protein